MEYYFPNPGSPALNQTPTNLKDLNFTSSHLEIKYWWKAYDNKKYFVADKISMTNHCTEGDKELLCSLCENICQMEYTLD